MFIERSGEGPNLVLLHGWAMSRHCWHYLLPLLERHYTTIRVNLPGHGEGCGSSFSFSRDDELITELSELIDNSAIWIGWSLGGFLAQRVAHAYPHKVKHLICVSSGLCYMQTDNWKEGVPEKNFNHFLKVFEADHSIGLEDFLSLQVADSENANKTLKILKILLAKSYDAQELIAALELLRTHDMREAAAHYRCPVLFIGGTADILLSMNSIKASSALVAQGRAVMIEGAGHAPMISHAKNFTRILTDYLDITTTDAYQ